MVRYFLVPPLAQNNGFVWYIHHIYIYVDYTNLSTLMNTPIKTDAFFRERDGFFSKHGTFYWRYLPAFLFGAVRCMSVDILANCKPLLPLS